MMSRTFRYFKLLYIVGGILISNEDICKTLDQIQIAPRVELKETFYQQQSAKRAKHLEISKKNSTLSNKWFQKFKLFQVLNRLKSRVRPQLSEFNLWTIPNYFIERSTNLLCRTFVVNSDCDLIYK